MSEATSRPSWISSSKAIDLDQFALHCRQASGRVLSALVIESTVEQSKRYSDSFSEFEVDPLSTLSSFSTVDKRLLLEKASELGTIDSVSVCGNVSSHAVESTLELLVLLLTIIPSIKSLVLELECDAPPGTFQVDFLPLADRAPLDFIQLAVAGRPWIHALPLQIVPLCSRSKDLLLVNELQKKNGLGADFVATLLSQPDSSLKGMDFECDLVCQDALLPVLTEALGRPDCRLEKLHLRDALEESSQRDDLARFLAAVGKNTSLRSLTFSVNDWSAFSSTHVAMMLTVNRGLCELCLDADSADVANGSLVLLPALGMNRTLEKLSLGCLLDLGDEFALTLLHLLNRPGSYSALRSFQCSHSQLGPQGILALTAVTSIEHLGVPGVELDGKTLWAAVEGSPLLPNLSLSCYSLDADAAEAIGGTIGRQSILVSPSRNDALLQIERHSAPMPYEAKVAIVPGCIVDGVDAAEELFKKHAQLKHVWFLDYFCFCEENRTPRIYQKLNRLVRTDIRQKIIDAVPLCPAEWCDALGAVAGESLEYIYHLVSKWRLEGRRTMG